MIDSPALGNGAQWQLAADTQMIEWCDYHRCRSPQLNGASTLAGTVQLVVSTQPVDPMLLSPMLEFSVWQDYNHWNFALTGTFAIGGGYTDDGTAATTTDMDPSVNGASSWQAQSQLAVATQPVEPVPLSRML